MSHWQTAIDDLKEEQGASKTEKNEKKHSKPSSKENNMAIKRDKKKFWLPMCMPKRKPLEFTSEELNDAIPILNPVIEPVCYSQFTLAMKKEAFAKGSMPEPLDDMLSANGGSEPSAQSEHESEEAAWDEAVESLYEDPTPHPKGSQQAAASPIAHQHPSDDSTEEEAKQMVSVTTFACEFAFST